MDCINSRLKKNSSFQIFNNNYWETRIFDRSYQYNFILGCLRLKDPSLMLVCKLEFIQRRSTEMMSRVLVLSNEKKFATPPAPG